MRLPIHFRQSESPLSVCSESIPAQAASPEHGTRVARRVGGVLHEYNRLREECDSRLVSCLMTTCLSDTPWLGHCAIGMPTPPPPPPTAAAAPAAEIAYVASLIAHLQGKPHVLLNHLGHNVVPKPDGVPRLGTVLRRHPSIFHVHQVGASDAVSLVPGVAPPEPSRQPGRPTGQNSARETARSSGIVEQAAKLFWQSVTNDPDLRTRCSSGRA